MTRSTTLAPNDGRAVSGSVLCGLPGGRSAGQHRGRMDLLIRSLERVAAVSVDEGPLPFCGTVVREVGEYLVARWVVLALRPRALPDATVRLVGRDPGGRVVTDIRSLPAHIRSGVQWARGNVHAPLVGPREVYLPLLVRGRSSGVLAAVHDGIDGEVLDVTELDLRALTVLGNQAVVSLQHDDGLHRTERKLVAAERRRIAGELHETVARKILSAGITVERCRGEVAPGTPLHDQLGHASRLARAAVHQVRASIHELSTASPQQDLPTLLRRLAERPATQPLDATVEIRGDAVAVPAVVTSAVLRVAGECLFNAATHGHARRAAVALSHREGDLLLAVEDDGDGDPVVVRRLADSRSVAMGGGYRRGLADLAGIVECLEGELEVTRSDLGGIRIQVRLPIRADTPNGGETAHG